jgi:predicted Zn-dependent protease
MAIEVDIVFAELSYANAYAVIVDDRVKVILSLSLLARFEGDREALQFILAHEFSHAWLGHLKDNQRAQREATFQQGGYLAGTLANFFIPFSGALVSQAVLGVGRERSRDEERQADEAALTWLENQGLPLCGALRLTQKLRPVHGAQSLGFLSTHPSLDEREAYFSERAAAVGEDCASGKI